MILENVYLEELRDIFDNNNKNYVSDETAIQNIEMLKVVYVQDDIPIGYAVVYFGKDFIQKEEYNIKIDNMKEKTAYIWQIITKKEFENRGIATEIINYIVNKYNDYDIYSSIDVTNIPSLKCHEKCGFTRLMKFSKTYNNKIEEFYIFKI